ncbi:MAG: hypothetical protein ACOX01_06920 [Methanobrevibacter boviskoreani]
MFLLKSPKIVNGPISVISLFVSSRGNFKSILSKYCNNLVN